MHLDWCKWFSYAELYEIIRKTNVICRIIVQHSGFLI